MVAPIILGSSIQSAFPSVVKFVTPFAPLLAVLASSLLACRFESFKLMMLYLLLNCKNTVNVFILFVILQCLLRELRTLEINN